MTTANDVAANLAAALKPPAVDPEQAPTTVERDTYFDAVLPRLLSTDPASDIADLAAAVIWLSILMGLEPQNVPEEDKISPSDLTRELAQYGDALRGWIAQAAKAQDEEIPDGLL